jgi:uncharacterized membrane protein YcfT
VGTERIEKGGALDAGGRERWIDVAKGIAIILVVLLHSTFDYVTDRQVWRWENYGTLIETFRMPLFFFTAGIFASRVLAKSFRELLDLRILRFGWLYALWTLLAVIVLAPVLTGTTSVKEMLIALAVSVVIPSPATWFIYAIVVYFLLGWAVRRLPALAQVALGLVLTVIFQSGVLVAPDTEWGKVGTYFLFFLLAVNFGPLLRSRVLRLRWWACLIAPAAYVGLLFVVRRLGVFGGANLAFDIAVWLVLSLLAVAAGCSVAILIANSAAFNWLYWLGSRTLQVYLLHWYLLAIGWWAITLLPATTTGIVPFLVPALTAFAIGGSLLIHQLTRRATFLYTKPAWLRVPTRRAAPSQAPNTPS